MFNRYTVTVRSTTPSNIRLKIIEAHAKALQNPKPIVKAIQHKA